jgi:hypothetical protein
MNFLAMQQELSDRLVAYDNSVSTDSTKLKRWINLAQQDICQKANWPFMLFHEIVQTSVDINAGTVAIDTGTTALTFTDAPAMSVVDRFIQFTGDSNWYKVTAHIAGATAATITPSYGGASNLTASTYKLRKLFYSTSSPLDSILDIKKMAPGRFLESANARDVDVFLPLYWDQGAVYKYIASVPDATGGIRFSLLYSPGTVENLQVRGIKALADMVADADLPLIPSRWHSAILDTAAFYGFSTLDDSRATSFYNKAEAVIQSMSETYDTDLGRQRVSRSLNTGILEGPAYVLPPQYGVNQA